MQNIAYKTGCCWFHTDYPENQQPKCFKKVNLVKPTLPPAFSIQEKVKEIL